MSNITETNIVNGLSELIAQAGARLESERTHPGCDPDRMDAVIKHNGERVIKLRQIREAFENLIAQVSP